VTANSEIKASRADGMAEGASRKDFEGAIGAVITRFNELEIVLIDLICLMIGDRTKGQAIGWALGFGSKVNVVRALAFSDDIRKDFHERLFAALKNAEDLSNSVRNQVAHAELWENPEDGSIGFRKGSLNKKKGFLAAYPNWDVPELFREAKRIEETADEIRAVQAVYFFKVTDIDVPG
jgi:hypothetical protein